MKKFLSRWLLIIVCVFSLNTLNAKQTDLLDLLCDDEVEASIKPRIKKSSTSVSAKGQDRIALGSVSLESAASGFNRSVTESQVDTTDDINQEIDFDEGSSGQSHYSLLDLLFEDTQDVSLLFPSKHEKYYRGQFKIMGLNYIDNSVCDETVPKRIQAARPIDQDELTAEEKAVVDKYYKLTKQQFESPWYMKFINNKIGYGIFAAADIEAGQLIAEYVGIIYDSVTYLSAPRNPRYCWNVNPPLQVQNAHKFYVDALASCNFTRIINHSYKPNVIPVPMHGPDGSRMLYVACEKIKKDEQLLVNYGEGYWVSRGEPEDLSR
jgi:SET domain